MTTARRLGLGLLGAGVMALGLAVPASAHVTVDTDTVDAGGFTSVTLTVPHGCEESPTRQLAIQIPEPILNAAPQVVPGWDAETTMATLDEPVETSHGEPRTERVAEITWTAQAGNELPSAYRQVFTIGFQAPEETGERLYFNVIQTCTEGETAWIEETTDGAEEPEHPAPFVDVVVADSAVAADGDPAAEAATSDGEDAATEPVAASTGTSDDDGSSSSDGLAIGGLVLGALGLAAGGTALLRSRPTP